MVTKVSYLLMISLLFLGEQECTNAASKSMKMVDSFLSHNDENSGSTCTPFSSSKCHSVAFRNDEYRGNSSTLTVM